MAAVKTSKDSNQAPTFDNSGNIEHSCIEKFQRLLHAIDFSYELSHHPKQLHKIIYKVLCNYIKVQHFCALDYDKKMGLQLSYEQGCHVNKAHTRSIKHYLSLGQHHISEQLALLKHQLETNQHNTLCWEALGTSPVSAHWFLLKVHKQEQNMAKLLLSIICKQLNALLSQQRYCETAEQNHQLQAELYKAKQLYQLNLLSSSMAKPQQSNGSDLLMHLSHMFKELFQNIAMELIEVSEQNCSSLYSSKAKVQSLNLHTLQALMGQGPRLINKSLLPLLHHNSKGSQDETVYSAMMTLVKTGELKHKQMLIVESLEANTLFNEHDLLILEYAAQIISAHNNGSLKACQQRIDSELQQIKQSIDKAIMDSQYSAPLLSLPQSEAKVLQKILRDPLTGLANRTLLLDRLEHALKRQQRTKEKFALLFIDLDNFKPINDHLGHNMGDEVLKYAAYNIKHSIRANDLACRWGGDEFIILLDTLRNKEEVDHIILRLQHAFSQAFTHLNSTINLCCSIGINLFSQGQYQHCNKLIDDCDHAMYQAKQVQGFSHQYVETSTESAKNSTNNIKENLSHAIEHNEIIPHYQAMIRLSDHQLLGFEVMARWKHHGQHLKQASEFIAAAKRHGLIAQLDLHILKHAVKQLESWNRSSKINNIQMCINLSSYHLQAPEKLLNFIHALKQKNSLIKQLIFEFAEKDLVENNTQALDSLKLFHDMGIKICLDSFGTGSSSLNALFSYPLDYIKIDRSYTHKMLNSSRDLALVRAFRDLSNDLGFHVVIEGIESQMQHDKLVELGCEYGQGHFIAHPMQQESISKLLN